MLNETASYYATLPFWELVAVFTALAYVILAAKQNIWCWPAALISTTIYTVIFYEVYLWMDSLLQIYYFVMAIYGWYCWRNVSSLSQTNKVQQGSESSNKALPVSSWPLICHIKAICILAAISLGLGFFMASNTPTDFPYLDSLTTVFAVYATYLVAQKVLENWLYWVAIDALSIYLYIEKGLMPTAVLFVLYTGIALAGYFVWRKNYVEQQTSKNQNDTSLENVADA